MSIRVNFSAYASYMTDSLHQWETNRVLTVTGLNLVKAPEVRFWNSNTQHAIPRQAEMKNQVITVDIPNSLLQDPLRIIADVGVYEGNEFKVVERVEIPVIPGRRPIDYKLEDTDGEVYSFNQLLNAIANLTAEIEALKAK